MLSKVCSACTTPFDHRSSFADYTVRMQAHYPGGMPYRSAPHAFMSVFREGAHSAAAQGIPLLGGLRALWRGAEATTFRGVVLSISQIASYDQVKQTLKRRGIMKEGMGLHITASLFAGWARYRLPNRLSADLDMQIVLFPNL